MSECALPLAGNRTPLNDKELAWQAWEESLNASWMGIAASLRLAIHESQNWRCCYCGVVMWAGEPIETLDAYMRASGLRCAKAAQHCRATIEHLRRRIEGGADLPENLAGACSWCNTSRGEMPAQEWFLEVQALVELGVHPHGVGLRGTSQNALSHQF